LFLLERLIDNLIWAASKTPPGVLHDHSLILLMGLMCIHLWDLLLTILKGNFFILLMGKQITRPIMLRILRSHMFLKTPRILCTLVSINLMQEDPLVILIHLTQCMFLLVFLCHTSIIHKLTDNYLSLQLWIS